MKEITLNHITKIEGHAKLHLEIDKGSIKRCELSSTEGARYFEGIVRGRHFSEAHEIVSRICGICSCAHVVAAITAVENALGYKPTHQTKKLRILLTLGERIRSHATHLYFLALPDYLGYESALAMASKHRKELQDALSLIKVGNLTIKMIGGRDLHPVSAAVGGFLKVPLQNDIDELAKHLRDVKKAAIKTCKLFSKLKYAKFETKGESFSLHQPDEYAVLDGILKSGKDTFHEADYRKFLTEYHEPYSTANFVVRKDKRYMVGALPRLNNNHATLSKDAKRMLKRSGLKLPCNNPYMNNVAQAIELVHCIDEAIAMCGSLKIKKESVAKLTPHAGVGVAAIEVPRGTLWHEYTLNDEGIITNANIITPTAQNLLNMQEDIRELVPGLLDEPKERINLKIEQLIRSYDPCFSCSAHFLEVKWEETE